MRPKTATFPISNLIPTVKGSSNFSNVPLSGLFNNKRDHRPWGGGSSFWFPRDFPGRCTFCSHPTPTYTSMSNSLSLEVTGRREREQSHPLVIRLRDICYPGPHDIPPSTFPLLHGSRPHLYLPLVTFLKLGDFLRRPKTHRIITYTCPSVECMQRFRGYGYSTHGPPPESEDRRCYLFFLRTDGPFKAQTL